MMFRSSSETVLVDTFYSRCPLLHRPMAVGDVGDIRTEHEALTLKRAPTSGGVDAPRSSWVEER